ncbi:MAG: S9 family peptidase [Bacteroidota bacterium]
MLTPPKAHEEAHELSIHGHTRIDPYFWMRNRDSQEVLDYLHAENAYTKASMAHKAELQEALYEEMKGRLVPDDSSVPVRMGAYFYYSRYEKGLDYPKYCRKKGSLEAEEEIFLDVNELAKGQTFTQVRGLSLSPDHQMLAFGLDQVGRRIYTLKFKDLTTGEILQEEIKDTIGNYAWAEDNQHLFYARQDQQTLRPHEIYRHKLGEHPEKDRLIFEEKDDTFNCYVAKSKSKKYLFIISAATLSTEVRFLPADQPQGDWQIFLPREEKHEYEIAHQGDHFYILTNYQATNFRVMRSPIGPSDKAQWEEVVPHRADVLLESMSLFEEYMVLEERQKGLSHIHIWHLPSGMEQMVPFDDEVYLAYVDQNPAFATQILRYGYQSMTRPDSTFELHLQTGERVLLKQQEIKGGFEPENYRSQRLWATAEDGTEIPISLVHHKDTPLNGTAPLLEYAYGSYGISLDPSFSAQRLSLLDRGFIFVIAHIRGGAEMGRHWYEDGKFLKKKNTFTDFIAVGEYLVREGITQSDRLFCMGGSAGGMLVGTVINMRPDLYHGAIAAVPFVDVVTTMLDEDIPLTTGEYDEWGNPNDPVYYEYMLSYSPYDNVVAQDYPHLLVTSGYHDSQVQYWEPTKWVAKLRKVKTGDHRLLLETDMESGHGGASGRFGRYKEAALQYAFLIDLVEELGVD